MARLPHLALPVVAIAAVVIPLRSLHGFDALSGPIDLVVLTYLSRIAWTLVAVVGFAAVGYAYASRSTDGPRRVFGVAAVAALVGVLVGNVALVFALGDDLTWGTSMAFSLAFFGTYSVLDAVTFALLTLGGYALSGGPRASRA